MDRHQEHALIDELSTLLENGSTAMSTGVSYEQASAYVDPTRLARERELFFSRYPLVVACSTEIPKPGSFITSEVGKLPVLTVRGDDGQARSMVNMCRHRANLVCQEGSGSKRRFACNYHAWTYDRAGALKSTVDTEGFSDLSREEFGLVQLPTVERDGLVWVIPDPAAETPDIAAFLGADMDREIAALKLADWIPYERKVMRQPFNWKLAADTFLEVFHLAYLHKETVGPLFLGNTGAYNEWGLHHRYSAVRKSFPEMLTQKPEARSVYPHSSLVHMLFPNTLVTWQMDHIEHWRFYPSAHKDDECIVELVMLIDQPPTTDSATRHWDKNWQVLMDTILNEDFATMSVIQKNLESGAMDKVTFGRNEIALQHFHRELDSELEKHCDGASVPVRR